MARSKKTPQPLTPVTTPRREVPVPPWAIKDWTFGSMYSYRVREIVASSEWVLPPFQREVVWTPEQQAAFCNTVWAGLPTAYILVWQRYVDGKRVRLVLDGQQRLTALGATVHRADGSVNPPPRAYFDIKAGSFSTEPGRWALTMRDISDSQAVEWLRRSHELEAAEDWDGYDLWENTIYATERVQHCDIKVFEIESRAPVEYVLNAFRAINHPGTPFDAAEIERLIQTAADFK